MGMGTVGLKEGVSTGAAERGEKQVGRSKKVEMRARGRSEVGGEEWKYHEKSGREKTGTVRTR